MCLLVCLQVWGENNISVVNATSNLIIGPQYITVTIRNASNDAPSKWNLQAGDAPWFDALALRERNWLWDSVLRPVQRVGKSISRPCCNSGSYK